MKPNICIGSAQFGMKYGATNKTGITSIEEIKQIINQCSKHNVKYIDTAMDYGSAENNLGKCIKEKNKFKIITKISAKNIINSGIFSRDKAERALEESLGRLNISKLEGLLIHSPEILGTEVADELLRWMVEKKEQGKISKLGVSIYEKEDLSKTEMKHIEIVQVPISVFDQRIYQNGGIDWLYENGIKIFARSIFLQGILLERSIAGYELSPNMNRHHRQWIDNLKRKNVSQLQECINFVSSIKKLEAITIGVENKKQLSQILQIREGQIQQDSTKDYSEWKWGNINDIDPRKWQTSKGKSS